MDGVVRYQPGPRRFGLNCMVLFQTSNIFRPFLTFKVPVKELLQLAQTDGQKPEPPPPPSITVPSPHPPEGPPPRKRPHEDGPEYGILGQQFPSPFFPFELCVCARQ